MAESVVVHLACNEPTNGVFAGEVWAAEFDTEDHSVSIAGGCMPEEGLRLVIRPGEIVVAGERFACSGHQQWVGNWCWDSFELSLDEAKRLLRRLLLERWVLEEWDDGSPFAGVIAQHRMAENTRRVTGG